ncbi:MAG: hypothetical protein ACK4FB_08225 [Brevundimonas sp.]|uniref:hypothetical protein n=1 Tax=Brevundimonas sp. TaxID=1871086 RepID=UPI00391AC5B0
MTVEQLKHLIGDLARPYCLIATGTATATAIFSAQDAGIITASGAVLIALYGFRSWENTRNRPGTHPEG